MDRNEIFEIAPCLREGPMAAAGAEFVEATEELPATHFAAAIRTWAAHYFFVSAERAFRSNEDPTLLLIKGLRSLTSFIKAAGLLNAGCLGTAAPPKKSRETFDVVEKETGEHYGNLFKDFDEEHYYDEAKNLLGVRLERNRISIENIERWEVLDAGCGGGRYSLAWVKLGAKVVTGIDFSESGIENAKARAGNRIPNLTYKLADVLRIPFEDNSFDCVFSNGVLHHTRDWRKGISELVRVLRPNGFGWLYLNENPGGYFWDVIEILRVPMRNVDNAIARASLKLLGIPPNRIFYVLDHIMVPIDLRFTEEEIEDCLAASGANRIRKLTRGADFDRIEQIYQRVPYATLKFGVGEQRYIFSK
jgi:ubiquinone/menaquinone biosynthesis C-methylase UbiE